MASVIYEFVKSEDLANERVLVEWGEMNTWIILGYQEDNLLHILHNTKISYLSYEIILSHRTMHPEREALQSGDLAHSGGRKEHV